MPYRQLVKHPLSFIYLSCLLDRGLIKSSPFLFGQIHKTVGMLRRENDIIKSLEEQK